MGEKGTAIMERPIAPASRKEAAADTVVVSPHAKEKPYDKPVKEKPTDRSRQETQERNQQSERITEHDLFDADSVQIDETEVDPIEEKIAQIEKNFEELGKHLDPETKEALKEQYIEQLLSGDTEENGEEEPNTTDKLAEMTRLLTLLIALVMLLLNPKDTYSGEDLGLSSTPPEGQDDSPLTKALNGGLSTQDTWNNFRNEVNDIQNKPFGEFMAAVLAANERNSSKSIKVKKPEKAEKKTKNPFKKLKNLIGGLVRGKKSPPASQAAPARRAA